MPQGKFKNKSQVSFSKKKKHEPNNKSRKGILIIVILFVDITFIMKCIIACIHIMTINFAVFLSVRIVKY